MSKRRQKLSKTAIQELLTEGWKARLKTAGNHRYVALRRKRGEKEIPLGRYEEETHGWLFEEDAEPTRTPRPAPDTTALMQRVTLIEQRLETIAVTPKPATTMIVRRPKGVGQMPLNDYVALIEGWFVLRDKECAQLKSEITQQAKRIAQLERFELSDSACVKCKKNDLVFVVKCRSCQYPHIYGQLRKLTS